MPTVSNTLLQSAAQGAYITYAQEGTRNTGVALTAATGTTYSATAGMLLVYNQSSSGGPNVYMDYLQIAYDAVNTTGVAGFMYHALDVGNRYSSGGVLMTGWSEANPGANPAGVLVYTGALVLTVASANVRDFYKTVYINGVGAATPTMLITLKYGAMEQGIGTVAIPATTAGDTIFRVPPVVIAPGMSYVINEFQTGRGAAGTGEFFVGLTVGP